MSCTLVNKKVKNPKESIFGHLLHNGIPFTLMTMRPYLLTVMSLDSSLGSHC